MAKSLFIFTLLYFSFVLTTQGGVWGSVMSQVFQVSQSHDGKSHDECGKEVHRPCSSCISSIQKITGTPLSFLSQTSFGHISINSPSILTVLMATESP